ncbi:MAG: hypothetical protein JXO49_10720 [Deltaproteobacteria bacterium]|nr:hypothetical protein [Candidatus Anaeroferrophillus wilburensis]MBN2889805.1 hypothetical protein [Deltaproteobacteria bacterium]
MRAIVVIALVALVVNIPLGYLRAGVRKFSLHWFVYVHLSIPLVVWLRLSLGIRYQAVPIFIAMAIGGQLVGGRLRRGDDRN